MVAGAVGSWCGLAAVAQMRSTIVATPMPPPTHNVARP